MSGQNRSSLVIIGVWLWGATAALLAATIFIVVLTGYPVELYGRFKESATALGAIVAAGALAWSHFFKAAENQSIKEQLVKIDKRLDDLTDS